MTPMQGNPVLTRTRQEEGCNPQAFQSADNTANIGEHLQIHPSRAEQIQADANAKPVSSNHPGNHREEEVRHWRGVQDPENEFGAHIMEQNGDLQFRGYEEDNGQRGWNDDDQSGVEVHSKGPAVQNVDPGVGDMAIFYHAEDEAIFATAAALMTLSWSTSTRDGALTARNVDNFQSHDSQLPEPQSSIMMAVSTAGHNAETRSDRLDQQIDCDAASGSSTAK
jgi:hypothetical protein